VVMAIQHNRSFTDRSHPTIAVTADFPLTDSSFLPNLHIRSALHLLPVSTRSSDCMPRPCRVTCSPKAMDER
jgi:hypothetical protein